MVEENIVYVNELISKFLFVIYIQVNVCVYFSWLIFGIMGKSRVY